MRQKKPISARRREERQKPGMNAQPRVKKNRGRRANLRQRTPTECASAGRSCPAQWLGPSMRGTLMKSRKKIWLCLCLLPATLALGQAKKPASVGGGVSAAATICDKPYAAGEVADGWPEAPITILFHREKSKAPWAHNPAIRVPGLEAATPASARTLVCVEESRLEMGHYDSGEPGYVPAWSTIFVRLSDHKVYFMGRSLDGEMPPEWKYKKGAGVGKAPTEILVRW